MNNIIEIISGDINISKKERIISVAGGVALLVLGITSMKKKKLAAWSELATGAALLLRGSTGYCPVNAALKRNSATDEIAEEAEDNFNVLAE